MAKYKLGITVETDAPEKAQKVGNLLQGAVNKVAYEDMVKLLAKVNSDPSIVKKALFFI